MGLNEIFNRYEAHVKIKKDQNLFRDLKTQPPGVCFTSNDYLGLSHHRSLISSAQKALNHYGVGAQASRLLGNMNEIFSPFEQEIAQAKNQESALIFASGFQANASVLAALLDSQVLGQPPLVFCDRLNHASMHFGCAAAHVQQIRYRHLDLDHLEALLEKNKSKSNPKFILTESVFGMDGDVVNLPRLVELADHFQAFLYVDEAHSTGLYGHQGYGITSSYGSRVAMVMGTFSKALGSFGAYVATSETIRSYIINRCGGFIYATALPPSVIASAQAAWHLIPELNAERSHLALLSNYLRKELRNLNFNIGHSTTHIIPIILESSELVLRTQQALSLDGFKVSAIRPPTVPAQTARLRIAVRADHTLDQVERLISCLSLIAHKFL
jgi:8-amino-7-oxononanoate synthase